MKNLFFRSFIAFIGIAGLYSCKNSGDAAIAEVQKKDSIITVNQKVFSASKLSDSAGIIGIFDIPEMLTISKLDSAPLKDVSFKVAKNYGILEAELNAIGAELDGMPGMLNYNNDENNFIFECVLPIKKMPSKEPKNCKIVVLESTPMLIFNFYGPYEHLFSAYDRIKKHMAANKLAQSGPMREFYLSDPTIEKDPAKWQTRIMVPVAKTK